MTIKTDHPLLLQINTRVWLHEVSGRTGRPVSLAAMPEEELDRIAQAGFNWVWLMSVWKTSDASRQIALTHSKWRTAFESTLADLKADDICGSGFAVSEYSVADNLGGDGELALLRRKLADRGIRLMLDFVPNHTGLNHPWIDTDLDFFMAGTQEDLERRPTNYTAADTGQGRRILAHGRDPNFEGWPDTLQLNFANPRLHTRRMEELTAIAGQCDGVRCDMAMLIDPAVFRRTWGVETAPFWPEAIDRVKTTYPDFIFLAEVYWDLEYHLQQQGFDYCYDKRLYDRLRGDTASAVRQHLTADIEYQNKLARFLENHDERRAAAVFQSDRHMVAAVLTFFLPGLKFFHQGQLEGARIRIPPHLCRGPHEDVNIQLQTFYTRLLEVLRQPVFHKGRWQLLRALSDSNDELANSVIAYGWQAEGERLHAIALNFDSRPVRCRLPFMQSNGYSDPETPMAVWDVWTDMPAKKTTPPTSLPGWIMELGPWEFQILALDGGRP